MCGILQYIDYMNIYFEPPIDHCNNNLRISLLIHLHKIKIEL